MKILTISPMGVYPPKGGGLLRIFHLSYGLSKYHEVFMFSQGIRRYELKFPLKSWKSTITDNYVEYRYVNLPTLITMYLSSKKNISNIFSGDVLKLSNPKILRKISQECDIIQVELPWQFNYMYDISSIDTPIVYEGHNVEIDMVRQTISGRLFTNNLINLARKKEEFAVINSDAVFMVSDEDKARISELYGVSKSKIHVIPNGADINNLKPTDHHEKHRLKEKYGFKNKIVILFSGSSHPPNIEAVKYIIKLSKNLSNNCIFLVAGRCGDFFKNKKYHNIIFTGFVKDMDEYFKIADIAINPMFSGGGTNIKMIEYMASGLPILSTEIGARGLSIENKRHAIVCNGDEFLYWIEMLSCNEDLRATLGANARKLAEEKYDWNMICKKVDEIYRKLVK